MDDLGRGLFMVFRVQRSSLRISAENCYLPPQSLHHPPAPVVRRAFCKKNTSHNIRDIADFSKSEDPQGCWGSAQPEAMVRNYFRRADAKHSIADLRRCPHGPCAIDSSEKPPSVTPATGIGSFYHKLQTVHSFPVVLSLMIIHDFSWWARVL